MSLLRLIPLLLVTALVGYGTPAPAAPGARNLFVELLGKTDAEVAAKVDATWRQLFYGDNDTQRVYYPVGADMAYIADIGNGDVRTEGMSYGMMIAVQLDHRDEFNRLWRWAKTHMYHERGPLRGYFAWHCAYDGRQLSPGPASDGEEWFATALLFASHRWGDGTGIFNYGAEAQALLRTMRHKGEDPDRGDTTAMFDPTAKQIVFVPHGEWASFTDPSYHLPAFTALWARWAAAPADRAFYAEVTATSRAFFHRAAHPQTGLMPDYAEFDGRPRVRGGHEDFRFDAWRTLANVALDQAWFAADPWQVEQSNRVLRFLAAQEPAGAKLFRIDGTPLAPGHAPGLTAMAAVAGLAADPALARPFVQLLWDAPVPTGQWRYYDGLLQLLGLLQAGGRFRIHPPPAP